MILGARESATINSSRHKKNKKMNQAQSPTIHLFQSLSSCLSKLYVRATLQHNAKSGKSKTTDTLKVREPRDKGEEDSVSFDQVSTVARCGYQWISELCDSNFEKRRTMRTKKYW